ncbi:MAG: hypothetical protein M0018_03040 [Nitrospiraceae bacterium]|nr:hypothetical protein [Nitrospiraceae bacterium]
MDPGFFQDAGFLQNLFDAVPAFMFIVDPDVRIYHLNAAALSLLNTGRDNVLLKRGGEALHCIHSHDVPEGCGRGQHCGNCVVRNSVGRAFKGEHVNREEVKMELASGAAVQEVYLSVTASPFSYLEDVFALLVLEDISARKRSEIALNESLKEKELLLMELYHRTKNNMNSVSSLLSLQMGSIKDPGTRLLFKEAQGRIRTMAMVHEMLYKTKGLSQLDMKDYLEQLARSVIRGYEAAGVILDMDLDPVQVSLDVAMPCGLIVNELLSNSMKHAFTGRTRCKAGLSLKANGTEIELACYDNGTGFPEDFQIERSGALGLRLVGELARQLVGELDIRNENGAKVTVRFDASRV